MRCCGLDTQEKFRAEYTALDVTCTQAAAVSHRGADERAQAGGGGQGGAPRVKPQSTELPGSRRARGSLDQTAMESEKKAVVTGGAQCHKTEGRDHGEGTRSPD